MIDTSPARIGRRLGNAFHVWYLAAQRALVSDLHRVRATPRERRVLAGEGAAHARVVDYLAWRRGCLLASGALLGLAGIGLLATLPSTHGSSFDLLERLSTLVAAVFVLAAATRWNTLSWSRGLTWEALGIAVGAPVLAAALGHTGPDEGSDLGTAAALVALLTASTRGLTTAKTAFPGRSHAGAAVRATATGTAAAMALVCLWASRQQAPPFAVFCCLGLVVAPALQGIIAGTSLGQPRMDSTHASHAVRRARRWAAPAYAVGVLGVLAVIVSTAPDGTPLVGLTLRTLGILSLGVAFTADSSVVRLLDEWHAGREWEATEFAAEHSDQLGALARLWDR